MQKEIRKRGLQFTQVDKLGVISFLTNLSIAFVTTIWAIYLESVLHNISSVGFLTGFFTFVGIIASVLFVPIIEQNSKVRIFTISVLIFILSYLLFSVTSNVYLVILIGLIITIATVTRINSFGIILRDKSKDFAVSKNVSIIYTFFNLAWLIGPLIGGFISEKYGISRVFLISAIVMFATILLFKSFKITDNRVSKKIDSNLIKLIKNFFRNKDRMKIYFISGGITFWNTLIYVYLPILIIQKVENDLIVGYFLSAVIIPPILLEYFFGRLTGKVGFKKIFFGGYLILAIAALISFFVSNIYLTMGLLVFGGIGIAMLEPTTEAYFFDLVSKNQRDKYYGPYNTTIEINSLIAALSTAGILLFLPFKFVFLFIAIVMFLFALISLRIRNIVEVRRK